MSRHEAIADPSKSLSNALPTIYTKRFAHVVQEKSRRLATNGSFRSASCGWIMFGVRPSQTSVDLESSILSTFHHYITDGQRAGYNGEVQASVSNVTGRQCLER